MHKHRRLTTHWIIENICHNLLMDEHFLGFWQDVVIGRKKLSITFTERTEPIVLRYKQGKA